MTGNTKFAILDDDFLRKMIGECDSEVDRGFLYTLYYTGMHGSLLRILTKENLVKEGPRYYLQWRRTKTNRAMQAPIPAEKVSTITVFLESKKKTLQWYNVLLKEIGARAGYQGLSTMSFRHTRCIRAWKEGRSLPEIMQVMGTSAQVALRNYSKLNDSQLDSDF